jgi:hypothetical protein
VSTASSTKGWIVKGLLSLGLLAVLTFALNSVAFSGANFTAGSASVVALTAGTLLHVNNQDGRLTIDATSLTPGHSVSGSMTLTGQGTVAGAYTLSASDLVDSPAFPRLSDALELAIEGGSGTLYDGPVSGFSSADLGTLGPGDSRSYVLTLTYPDGTDDSRLQGANMMLGLQILGVTP